MAAIVGLGMPANSRMISKTSDRRREGEFLSGGSRAWVNSAMSAQKQKARPVAERKRTRMSGSSAVFLRRSFSQRVQKLFDQWTVESV